MTGWSFPMQEQSIATTMSNVISFILVFSIFCETWNVSFAYFFFL